MVAGPEVSRLGAEYEAASEVKDVNERVTNHEQTEQTQHVFFEKVDNWYNVMKEMGNPFQEESTELLSLDTKVIATSSAAEMVATHYEKGRTRFSEFMKDLKGVVLFMNQSRRISWTSFNRNQSLFLVT